MVQFLVESGSDINRGDNEGWTPLHAAASCGFIQITKYLIEHGANVGAVNSEGELPLDVATEDAMERLLKGEIKKQGVDVDQARKQEQRVMLQDATAVRTGSGSLVPHHNTKATALHVAAAKGYIEVLKVLLECKIDVDSRDVDGWTALHAAAHWGQEEVCSLLADHMCDMAAVNNVGQTPLDVSHENLVGTLEELQKKQNAYGHPDTLTGASKHGFQRRTSISRMSSKEKICLHEREKHPPPALRSTPAEEEEEEQPAVQSQAKASSSSSSEEDSESESDAESEKAKNREIINNLNNKHNSGGLLATSSSAAGNAAKKEVSKSQSTEAPGSWRTSLRKADSSVTLGSAGGSDASQDPPRPLDSGLGMTRSASSPRAQAGAGPAHSVPPHLQYSRRQLGQHQQVGRGGGGWLSRSSSYTRRHHSQSGSDLTGSDLTSAHPALPRRNSQEATEKKKDPESVTTSTSAGTTTSTSSTPTTTTSSSGTTKPGETEAKQRRKSYLTPVRDEEAEAQRKARSRHARQSRRSTQGVTLTDLQEAEKTIKTDNKEREKKKEDEKEKDKEKEAKQKKAGEEGEVSWRSRIANLQKSDLLGLTQPPGTTPRPQASDRNEVEASTGENRPTLDSQLFDEVSRENSHLQSQLQDTQRIVSQTRVDLEKATQRQERISDCSNLLELEKKERRMLERRVAELEEELKTLCMLQCD
ncbi:hypothetical protein CRUP_005481 [Coryphaenoides rupestris]|nr:hypothetical protein CRUP_005481 [Coryphaenoides rupestris]